MANEVTRHTVQTARHTTSCLSCGATDAPLVIFIHGWPELSISRRHQLNYFGECGFRAIAPDMRGYGLSTVHQRHEDYAMEHIVQDVLELLAELGRVRAIWVGHDWDAPVVWNIASHHPERCIGVAALCVPYAPGGSFTEFVSLVDRDIYPESEFPAGQWEYQLFYTEKFDKASATFEANPFNTIKALFRKGDPAGQGKPGRLAFVRKDGGWFGGKSEAPNVPLDTDMLSEQELHQYASALQRNGFFGPDSWYMNERSNMEYAKRARDDGRLAMPVLFLHASYDYTCCTVGSRLADPMREYCDNLSEATVPTGHWMAQEKPASVNAALVAWISQQFGRASR